MLNKNIVVKHKTVKFVGMMDRHAVNAKTIIICKMIIHC